VEVEDGLAAALTDVDDDAVVVEPLALRGLRDEVEHPLDFVRWKLADLPKRGHMTLGQHEQVRVRTRIDVADRDEAVGRRDVVAVGDEAAEQAVLRQRGSPPP
jgi:hypothetical protein